MSNDKRKLVCAPAQGRDLNDYVPGTITTHTCSECGAHVLVSPASQTLLAQDPIIDIVCFLCIEPKPDDTLEVPETFANEARDFFKKHSH